MSDPLVSIVRYQEPLLSVARAIELCRGFDRLPSGATVFIKPNIVFWSKAVPFPKWGVITTSRVVQDVVHLLKEHGVAKIFIGEGPVIMDPKDDQTVPHAFASLGYGELAQRYGVKTVNVHEGRFDRVEIEDGITLKMNRDLLESDFVVDLPVLKTHNQTVVSLGTKNLKGVLDMKSRKRCHNADPEKDLNYIIAKLPEALPPALSLLDGIYTLERGPSFDGRARRSNVLVASSDILAADMVGAGVLGYKPAEVPHLVQAARNRDLEPDLSWVEMKGEPLDSVASLHEYDFAYSIDENGVMPVPLAKHGIKGLTYHKYDSSMCTYCSGVNGIILTAIRNAWQGRAWDDVEVLTGKRMKPTPGMKKTILLGKCMYLANKDHADINQLFAVKSCPPKPKAIVDVFRQAGIELDSTLFDQMEMMPGFFLKKYENQPDFEESFYHVE